MTILPDRREVGNFEFMISLFNAGMVTLGDLYDIHQRGIDVVCAGGNVIDFVKHDGSVWFNSEYYEDASLCWFCQRAVGKCEWSILGKHVDGWEADEGLVAPMVRKCPKYVADISAIMRSIPD